MGVFCVLGCGATTVEAPSSCVGDGGAVAAGGSEQANNGGASAAGDGAIDAAGMAEGGSEPEAGGAGAAGEGSQCPARVPAGGLLLAGFDDSNELGAWQTDSWGTGQGVFDWSKEQGVSCPGALHFSVNLLAAAPNVDLYFGSQIDDYHFDWSAHKSLHFQMRLASFDGPTAGVFIQPFVANSMTNNTGRRETVASLSNGEWRRIIVPVTFDPQQQVEAVGVVVFRDAPLPGDQVTKLELYFDDVWVE